MKALLANQVTDPYLDLAGKVKKRVNAYDLYHQHPEVNADEAAHAGGGALGDKVVDGVTRKLGKNHVAHSADAHGKHHKPEMLVEGPGDMQQPLPKR